MKIRLVKSKYEGGGLRYRPKSFTEYKKLASDLVGHFRKFENIATGEPENLCHATQIALHEVEDLIAALRDRYYPDLNETDFLINGRPIPYEVSCWWALKIAVVREWVGRINWFEWQGRGPNGIISPQFYEKTSWTKKPNTTVFTSAGWSTLEAANLFLTRMDTITQLTHIRLMDEFSKEYPRFNDIEIIFEPKPNMEMINFWRDCLINDIQEFIPEKIFPDCGIGTDFSKYSNLIEYELDEYKKQQQTLQVSVDAGGSHKDENQTTPQTNEFSGEEMQTIATRALTIGYTCTSQKLFKKLSSQYPKSITLTDKTQVDSLRQWMKDKGRCPELRLKEGKGKDKDNYYLIKNQ